MNAMKENRNSDERLAACPRCGYELRGIVDSWTESCPLLGVCSECGLDFNWSEILHPEKYEPLWCVEFPNAGPMWRSALKTYLMSFRPWRFWRELKMANDVRWRRLSVYCLLLITPLLLCYVIEQTAVAVQVWRLSQQQLITQQKTAKRGIIWLQQQIDESKASESSTAQMNALNLMAQNPGSINFTLTEAIGEAVFFPLRSISDGMIMSPWGTQAYPAPINLHAMILTGQNPVISFPRILGMRIQLAIITFLLQAVLFPGIPLAFLLLPMSRHIAKVRWGHIFRVLLYSLFIPVTVFYLMVILFSSGILVVSLEPICIWLSRALFAYGSWIALIVWWALATKHYLKIPHGWMVAILLAVMVVLLLLALFVMFAYAFRG